MVRTISALVGAASVAASVLIAGCGSSAGGGDSRVQVVASTNVYGNIASTIGGSKVHVTSIINDPSQDPHSYEADARTQLELSKADIVMQNGGGYDDFVHTMLNSLNSKATVIDAVTVSGRTAPVGGELNEHIWYDLPSVRKIVEVLVADLSAKVPAGATTFRRNAASFTRKLTTMESTEASIRSAHHGEGAAITEPVPLYMLSACGLVNRTPPLFSRAIEEGNGVPIRVLDQTLALFRDHAVQLLAYNEQTSGQETDKVVAAARSNGVGVVPVTETLPSGKDYVSWMSANLAAIEAALA